MLFMLAAQSSVPFFIGDEYLIAFFFLSLIVYLSKPIIIDKFIFNYIAIFFIILIAQAIFFWVFEFNTISGYLLRIGYAYLTIKVIGNKFDDYYINIIYFFAILSLVIYIPNLISNGALNDILLKISKLFQPYQLHDPGRQHILIYTFGQNYLDNDGSVFNITFRNSGPFWEPGGFGVFLILAIIFETIKSQKIITKKNIIFSIATLTTLSTGSFIAFFFLVIFYFLTYHTPKRIFIIILFFIGSTFIFLNSPFLVDKFNNQFYASQKSLAYAPRNRFVSGKLDLIDFLNNPIFGTSRYEQFRFKYKESKFETIVNHRNNGTTNLLVEFGIFGFFTFFYFMFKSFKIFCSVNKFKKSFSIYVIFIILILGFSQMIFIKPFFIGLSFLFLSNGYKSKIMEKSIRKNS